MMLEVRVQPRSSKEEILKLERQSYKVYMREPALEGKANDKLREMLAGHFNTSKSRVKIVQGGKSRNKIVEVI